MMGETERINTELIEQRRTVTEQGQILAVLASSIGEIKSYMKESIEIQREQAVLFEKFTNHEEQNNGEHTLLHKRIDKLDDRCKNIEDTHKLKCDLLTPSINNGDKAYKALLGILGIVGTMFLGTVYHFIFGDK